MDGLQRLLDVIRDNGLAVGHLRGVLHIAIGRKVTELSGVPVAAGVTWRELAELLKVTRFDPTLGLEVGADPDVVAPRDRQRFWYTVIAMAQPDSAEAVRQAEALAVPLQRLGFVVGPPPAGLPLSVSPPTAFVKKPKKK